MIDKEQPEPTPFDRWFGDSKVVDENRQPLPVYHGTDADFTVFRTRSWEGGAFFTSNKLAASSYGEKLITVYLCLQNPLVVQAKDWISGNVLNDETAREEGHDGYIILGHDVSGHPDCALIGDTYVVFRPEQIKSATQNNGEYGPQNPDIRFSVPDSPGVEDDEDEDEEEPRRERQRTS